MRQPRPLIGKRPIYALRMLRQTTGLTLAQVAKRMGTSAPDLSRLETGRYPVAADYVRRYARALGIPYRRVWLAYLLTVQLAAVRLLEWSHEEIKRMHPRNRA
jgi:transcriptional regulator with XRE-family HTH domain